MGEGSFGPQPKEWGVGNTSADKLFSPADFGKRKETH